MEAYCCRRHAWGSLGSQISTRGTWNVEYIGLSLQEKECNTSYLLRRLGSDMLTDLVTFRQSVWAETFLPLDPTLIINLIFSVYRIYLYGLYKEF